MYQSKQGKTLTRLHKSILKQQKYVKDVKVAQNKTCKLLKVHRG